MAKYAMLFYSSAKPGRDAEYLEWYRSVHLGEVCAVPGGVSGRLLEVLPTSPNKPAANFVSMYELDVEDPAALLQELFRRSQAGEMHASDVIDPSSVQITFLSQKT